MKIKISADLLDGMVLALLAQNDYYGYALTQDMQAAIEISESTMYPVLRRLQKKGFLTTYDQPFQGRNRRYYQITEEGSKHLAAIKEIWSNYKYSLDQIFFGGRKEE
ncbi:PadR family transcriptional regulator [Liquorilactobacillus cacaonum]|uniref:PadR family transcriptional regulator n=1 Tax=Liquorilactobacillus cacaonum DSM 21116 TaxID=1423729 RepID=A0A0R2CF47_9LACO|nr:PadR family transcriptional regulator [Liquorilactobacillus cacaonum]KRM90280.1 PadR family transcriptional regulator [Liquorilactobacillus cacaonum DSM 21116]